MIIEIAERWNVTPRYARKGQRQRYAIVTCDVCAQRYELPVKYAQNKLIHTCSQTCNCKARSVGGVLYQRITSTNVQKYGKKFASQCDDVKLHVAETNTARYGAKASSQNADVEEKRAATCIIRYGGRAATSDPNVRAKVKSTVSEKYGSGVLSDDAIRQHFNTTMISRHGVPWAALSPNVIAKQRMTNELRYGVPCTFQLETAKLAAHTPEAHARAHETKKRNGTYAKQSSLEEDRAHEVLCEMFGANDVERNVIVNNNWPIDFYIKSKNLFVQYDGAYGHGLDRPLDVIARHATKRDVAIHAQIERDLRQIEWFKLNDMRLVRIKGAKLCNISKTMISKALNL